MDINKILKKILEIDDLVLKKHEHSNKSIIDKITQTFLDNCNSAYNHISDNIRHITSTERSNWNDADSKKHTHGNKTILDKINQLSLDNWSDKYTKNEIDNKISQVITDLDWKESVNTFSDIAKTYPKPDDGWTVNVRDNNITYRYDGSKWIDISSNSIPLATSSLDGRMSKNDKAKLDGVAVNANNYVHPVNHSVDMVVDNANKRFTNDTEKANNLDSYNKRHEHGNKSIIDKITQSLLDTWNNAYSHISDTVKHITSDERTLWNTVSNKLDKSGGTLTGTLNIGNSEVRAGGNANKSLVISAEDEAIYLRPSKGDTTTEMVVNKNNITYKGNVIYHTGNKPNKNDIGLNNVDNTSDADKSISKATQTALNGKANNNHTHDDRYYSESEIDSKISTINNVINSKAPTTHSHNKSSITDMPTKVSQFTNDAGYITSKDVDTSQNHVHSNKSTLDKITQALIDSWSTISNKSDKSYVDGELAKKANNHNHPYRLDTWIPSWGDITGKPNTYTPSSHTHNNIMPYPIKSANDLPSTWEVGTYMTEVYNNGFPCSYGHCLTLKSNRNSITQICMEWKGSDATIGSMWIRNKRDCGTDKFSEWSEFSFTNHTHNYNDLSNKPNIPSKLSQLSKDINFDDRYYTEAEMNTKLAEKSNNNHTHNYAGSASVGGSANTAVKLATARNIALTGAITGNANFDGSGNINISTTRSGYDKYFSFNNVTYMKLLTITVTSNYSNSPIFFDLIGRSANQKTTFTIKFNNENNTTPNISLFAYEGSISYGSDAKLYKVSSTGNTYEVWIKQAEGYDAIAISNLFYSNCTVDFNGTTATSLPSNYATTINCSIATITSNVYGTATKATQDSDGKQINMTYVKKGMTWNDLEGI